MKHYKIKVSGQVQGVFYRQSTKEEAEKLSLTGTVRNMPDGSVEIHAEGEGKNLEELLSWCRGGPDYANVDKIGYSEHRLQGYEDFRVI